MGDDEEQIESKLMRRKMKKENIHLKMDVSKRRAHLQKFKNKSAWSIEQQQFTRSFI